MIAALALKRHVEAELCRKALRPDAGRDNHGGAGDRLAAGAHADDLAGFANEVGDFGLDDSRTFLLRMRREILDVAAGVGDQSVPRHPRQKADVVAEDRIVVADGSPFDLLPRNPRARRIDQPKLSPSKCARSR